jgi:hypothetical protein
VELYSNPIEADVQNKGMLFPSSFTTVCRLLSYSIHGDWRKLRNEKLHDLHWLRNIFRTTKSRALKREERVESMGEKRNV